MPRVSRKAAEQHRKDVVEAASSLFRQHGIDGVSVPELMRGAGLTHGAFYGHFASKEALAAEACTMAFDQMADRYAEIAERNSEDRAAARLEFVMRYTGKRHVDAFALGCPAAALCGEVARVADKGLIRRAFASGLARMAELLPAVLSRRGKAASRDETLTAMAMLVGGLVLARAAKGHAISDEIRLAVRHALVGRRP